MKSCKMYARIGLCITLLAGIVHPATHYLSAQSVDIVRIPQSAVLSRAMEALYSEDEHQSSYEDMLAGYLQNDLTIKNKELQLEKAALTLEKSTISQSPDVTLSSGALSATLQENGVHIAVSPNAQVSIPTWNNTTVSATLPVSVSIATGETSLSLAGSGISVSRELISNTAHTQEIARMEAQRAYEEAAHTLETQRMSVTKQFLQELLTLVNDVSNIISAGNTLYEAQTSLKTLTVQGYDTTSSSYRSADLQVKTAENTLDENTRIFENRLDQFSQNCGLTVTALPIDIPETDLLTIRDFPQSQYVALQSALWTYEINTLKRDTGSDFTLSGNAGYTYQEKTQNNSITSAHVLNTGVTAQYNGIAISGGISLPVNDISHPSFSLSIGWALNQSKTADITTQQDALEAQAEVLVITSAKKQYEAALRDTEQTHADLEWKTQSTSVQLSLYTDFLKDSHQWYTQGAISESQYVQAQRNYVNAVTQTLSAKINRLMYNINTELLFY